MHDDEHRSDRPPRQIRVHGVGGPQAARMLGVLHEEDTLSVPGRPPTPTRFVRRLPDDGVEAYEWGALTTGSWAKALWVLYLPFTLINAAGWAHPAGGPGARASQGPWPYRLLTHLVAVLATATYVLWMAYLLLDLVATRWVDHVMGVDPKSVPEVHGIAADAAGVWVPIVVPVLYLVLVAAVFGAPVLRRSRPTTLGRRAPAAPPHTRRDPAPTLAHPGFFAQDEDALRRVHTAVVGVVAVTALVLHLLDRDRLGLLLVLVAAAQAVVLVLLTLVDQVGRARWRWYEVADVAALPPGLWEPRRALPVGAALAWLGTALTHAAFAGAARLLRGALARFPEASPISVIEAHAELGAADVLGGVLGLSLVGLLFTLGHVADSKGDRDQPVVALARRAHLLGAWLLVANVVPVAAYAVLNEKAVWPDPSGSTLLRWYDGYPADRTSVLTYIGSAALSALPVAIFALLRRPHRTGLGRVVGNVWDVLTFWPRRFHPFAVPAAAERAVPELRDRIVESLAGRSVTDPLVVAAHSQGSVLSLAALAGLTDDDVPAPAPVRLVTFGSPLGTLYAPTWPAYIPAGIEAVLARLGPATEARGEPWVSFSRATDPVGAGVPGARNVVLPDPRPPEADELDPAGKDRPTRRRPLERPRWGVAERHSRYLSDPQVRRALDHPWPPAEPDPPVPRVPDPGPGGGGPVRWAHRGGADEGPENTVAAMRRALGTGRATGLEIDVRLARRLRDDCDEVLVVSHDDILGRAATGRGRIHQLTADALTLVTVRDPLAGPGAAPPDPAARLPRLTDLLDALPDVPLTIEIKGRRGRTAAETLAAVLAERWVLSDPPAGEQTPRRTAPVVVTSMRGRTVAHAGLTLRAHRLDPDVAVLAPGALRTLWFLFASVLPGARSVGDGYHRVQVPDLRILGRPLVTRTLLRKARDRNLRVDVWTVDDPAAMARVLVVMEQDRVAEATERERRPAHEAPLPVDLLGEADLRRRHGIMTDRPSVLARLAGVPDQDEGMLRTRGSSTST